MFEMKVNDTPVADAQSLRGEMMSRLEPRSRHLPVVGGPFTVHIEISTVGLTEDQFLDVLDPSKAPLKVDVTGKLDASVPPEQVSWMVRFDSGEIRSAHASATEENGKVMLAFRVPWALKDPDAKFSKGDMKYEVILLAIKVPGAAL